MIPDLRGANQICIFTQRGQGELGLLKRNEAAALGNDLAKVFQAYALHDAPAQDNPVRHKQIDQVGQTQAEIVRFARDGFSGQRMSFLSALEILFRGQGSRLGIGRLRLRIKPRSQRGPCR